MRPVRVWFCFAAFLAVLLGAMFWITATALRSVRAECAALRRAALEENVRLALWRMDSNLGPLIARENARPPTDYEAFHAAEKAYTRLFTKIEAGDVLVPSPLLTGPPPRVLIHFEMSGKGGLRSPQVPVGNMRDLAETSYIEPEVLDQFADRLERLRPLLARADFGTFAEPDEAVQEPPGQTLVQQEDVGQSAAPTQQQTERNTLEWQARLRSLSEQRKVQIAVSQPAPVEDAGEGLMRPVWVGEELLLVRRVDRDGFPRRQGCWLAWPGIRRWLLEDIRELLPAATLHPCAQVSSGGRERMLATIPVRLEPGPLPSALPGAGTDTWFSLALAWFCALIAAAAVAVLLVGVVRLNERRAAFVSAVTHELRSPLTTFRIYTEMLLEGMVREPEKRTAYLRTLHGEAIRLGHLVENVLSYARLENGRPLAGAERTRVAALLQGIAERLERRAERAERPFVAEIPDPVGALTVETDVSAVEQILYNLVDNACKYSDEAEDRRIHLRAARDGDRLALRVCDHGAGIAPPFRRVLFRPFRKSARDAANSAPGVGLGLALSRRLARRLGGDLALDASAADGACFVLTLPLAG